MTREEIIDNLELYTVGRLKKERVFITVEELQNLIDEIKALEQEPCEDSVSREAVRDGLLKYGFHAPDMTVTEFVENLPPINPQEWIPCEKRLPDKLQDVLITFYDAEGIYDLQIT